MIPKPAEKPIERAGMEFTFVNSLAIAIAILSLSGSAICFKYSADQWDSQQAASLIYFVLGNVVSLLGVTCTTVALRNNDTNVVYATIGGPGSAVLHVSLALVFQQALPWWQWLAIAIIVFGATMLHVDLEQLFRRR